MTEQQLAAWWAPIVSYFSAPFGLLSGTVDPLALIPVLGILCGLVGGYFAFVRREKQVPWLLPPVVLTAITPLIIGLAEVMMGWLGMSFVMFVGFIGLFIWISVLAHDATHRLPVWLLGLFLLSYVAWCGTNSVIIPHWL